MSQPNDEIDRLTDDILDALRQGNKIEAIKRYREASGKGLKESKEAIERLIAEHNIQMPASGCAGMLLAVFTAGASAWWWLA